MASVKKPKPLTLFTPRRPWTFQRDYKTAYPITSPLVRHGTIDGEKVEFFIHAEDGKLETWFEWRGIRYGMHHELAYSLVKMSTQHNNGLLHFDLDE